MSIKKSLPRVFLFIVVLGLMICIVLVGSSCSSDDEEVGESEQMEANDTSSQEEEGELSADDTGGTQSNDQQASDEEVSGSGSDTSSSLQNSSGDASSDAANTEEVNATYYDVYQEYAGDYDEPTCDTSSSYATLTGLCFAQLFDFDDDGVNELIVAYSSDDAAALAKDGQAQSPHYIVEVWKYKDGSAERVYQEAALITSEGSEAVAWGISQYGGYVVTGQSGLGATQYYYSIGDQGSTQFAEATLTDNDELMVNGAQADDDWLDESVFNEYLLAGNGMSQECEKTLAAFNDTIATLKQSAE